MNKVTADIADKMHKHLQALLALTVDAGWYDIAQTFAGIGTKIETMTNPVMTPIIAPDQPKEPERQLLRLHRQQHRQIARLDANLIALQEITNGCREDMHEPDEQGLNASFAGSVFDNAGTTGEMVVIIAKDGNAPGSVQRFSINLCDLIALARKAQLQN